MTGLLLFETNVFESQSDVFKSQSKNRFVARNWTPRTTMNALSCEVLHHFHLSIIIRNER